MKENKGRFPWRNGAMFETVDRRGHVFQWQNKPYPSQGSWWSNAEGFEWHIESIKPPNDYALTLIERYPSEQAEPAPFVFGPEHVGKRVRHVDGNKGVVDAIYIERDPNDQLVIKWNKGAECAYSLRGEYSDGDGNIKVFLDEIDPAHLPDLLARVEALEAQLQTQLDISQEFTQRIAILEDGIQTLLPGFYAPISTRSGDVSFDDLRFFIGETVTDPDPTAQKAEALKLIFGWRDGCEFMTVDERDGSVWQWSVQPEDKIKGDFWTALGRDTAARRVGEITPDAELSKILITRANG